MIYFGLLGLAVGLGLPIAVIGAGIGQGLAASKALEGMARQPEAMGRIQNAMILALVFVETLVIFTFVFMFLLKGMLPQVDPETVKSALLGGK